MRRLSKPKPPDAAPLHADVVLVYLLGDQARHLVRGGAVTELLIRAPLVHDPNLWTQHESFLLAEAARLGIARPFNAYVGRAAFFGEALVALRDRP